MSQPDPTEIVRPLLRTRQIREFSGEPVDDAALDALADVARWSGSAQNSQPWRFVVVRDPAVIRAIHEAGLPQTRALATAPAAIAITMPVEEGRAITQAYDEGRVAERILVGATMLGLGAGIAWVRGDAREAVARALGLPDDRSVRTIVAIGHPSEAARKPKSAPGEARLPREVTVHEDRWRG
ncbi:MAG TPA: nitroreductase family protein [Candidatus Limnocylindria bacterium]|nr:nitroreductase family protein [Candidatus Limnocylindria bacterium]